MKQEEKLKEEDSFANYMKKELTDNYLEGFQAGKSQQIEDELRFLKDYLEGDIHHTKKIEDRIKKLQEQDK